MTTPLPHNQPPPTPPRTNTDVGSWIADCVTMSLQKTKTYWYNTLAREKLLWQPIVPDHVGMYVCGPTVYDFIHLGNARSLVVFDVVYRLMCARFSRVTFVRNITDIDDKIIHTAKEHGVSSDVWAERMTQQFHRDGDAIALLPPTWEPTVSGSIGKIIAMIEALLDCGVAYHSHDHVLFHTQSWSGYGTLSRQDRDAMEIGARAEVAPHKRDLVDFVLWKPAPDSEPGWNSPWGRGRPGWHIECSAMALDKLGPAFDIHGGGTDLVFPHHENERAQTCAVCNDQGASAQVWLHNGMVTIDGSKMSKSKGRLTVLSDIVADVGGLAVRILLLQTHYRAPLSFSIARLSEAKTLTLRLERVWPLLIALMNHHSTPQFAANHPNTLTPLLTKLNDDLNTPGALSIMWASVLALEKNCRDDSIFKATLDDKGGFSIPSSITPPMDLIGHAMVVFVAARMMGFADLLADPSRSSQHMKNKNSQTTMNERDQISLSEDEILALIAQRNQARACKDFALADQLRQKLASAGITITDHPAGTTWHR